MYKNQLQELAQRSCFNLPWYTCVREGPDHAPRFKAVVNFNGETFESPNYLSTLRQAEHSAAETALLSLSSSHHSLAARILDETGVYKNLLQEIAQRVGAPLPQYTTFRSGSGHLPVFTGTVELAGITFTGDPAKNKKQAEKNAALSAWLSLKQLAQQDASSSSEQENNDEQEQIRIARALQKYLLKENVETVPIPFQNKFLIPSPRPSSPQRPTVSASKILPLLAQKTAARYSSSDVGTTHLPRFPVCGAAPYVPIRQCRPVYQSIARPVTLRTSVPVFSAPPRGMPAPVAQPRPVFIRQVVPVLAASPGTEDDPCYVATAFAPSKKLLAEPCENVLESVCKVDESTVVKCLEHLEI